MRKKPKRSYLRRKADTLFSLYVRKRGKCELQNKDSIVCNGNLQTMHVIGRANMRLRYDESNVFCGCSAHHAYYTYHPFDFYEMVNREFPLIYKYVMKTRNQLVKINYEEVIEKFK